MLINFEQQIDTAINAAVIALQNAVEQAKIDGISYLIPAYCSLTIGYNPKVIEFGVLEAVIKQIGTKLFENNNIASKKNPVERASRTSSSGSSTDSNILDKVENTHHNKGARLLKIPVCYEAPYALDLIELSEAKGISKAEIIKLHTNQTYKVYMLGFLPGFVFMGKVVPELACNRKVTPRLRVPASSVGIAGFQTGIYPMISPGGWQILGRTPLKIFDPQKENPFLFQAGDEVNFYAITAEEYGKIENEKANA